MGPERTCAIARSKHPRDELVRLVAAPDGQIVVDRKGSLPGRGVWVLPTADRLRGLAGRRKAIEHQLGASLEPEAVIAAIRAETVRAVLDGLSLAAAGGTLIRGHDRLAMALREGRVEVVAVASDASERTLRSLHDAAEDELFVVVPLTTEELGGRIGKVTAAAVGVVGSRATVGLLRQLRRLAALG